MPVKWALRDQVMGIDRPSYGHSLPVLLASSAQSTGRFLGIFIKLRPDVDFITWRRNLSYVPTHRFLHRHVTSRASGEKNKSIVLEPDKFII